MHDEDKAISDMYDTMGVRKDLFSVKQACKATGMSRAMLLRLEKEGFFKPRRIDEKNGYRYYDTINIFKLLQYKRLRLLGLSKDEINAFYDNGNDGIVRVIETMKTQRQILDQNIDILSLRISKDLNYSFSFYDFPSMTCLTIIQEYDALEDANRVGYNLSVEAISRGLMPSFNEYLFSERLTEYVPGSGNKARIKVYQPLEQDSPGAEQMPGEGREDFGTIEEIPECHTFSILIYGLESMEKLQEPIGLLRKEIKDRGLVPTGAPMRMQAVVARYTAMHLDDEEYVLRISVPVNS